MEITIVKTGGFAGVHEQLGPVDTAELGEVGQRIDVKVAEVGFFELPERLPEETRISDGFNYGVTISDGNREHTVGFSDGASRQAREPIDELMRQLDEAGAEFVDTPITGA